MKNYFNQIKKIIDDSDAILIGAGAGMGVDSGLPDFRSATGFYKLGYKQLANPKMLRSDPDKFWEFYLQRLKIYRETNPHKGFEYLLELVKNKDYFVFTSNVDGHFQKSGFDSDRIVECHGSIHKLQCIDDCSDEIWNNTSETIPYCKKCGKITRPNIYLFDDWEWNSKISDEQEERYNKWTDKIYDEQICVIEVGAGTTIPIVRSVCEHLFEFYNRVNFIRINLNESRGPKGVISVDETALITLTQIFES